MGTELGPPVPPRRADSAGCAESALLSNFSRCLRACSKVISRRAASAASAQLQHIPPPPALRSQWGGGGKKRTPKARRASHPCPQQRKPTKGWGAVSGRKGGTSDATAGRRWLVPWLDEAHSRIQLCLPVPEQPTAGTESPPPLPGRRPPLPRQVPGPPRRGSLPNPRDSQSPPQWPLAGRGSGDPGHPATQLFAAGRGLLPASPPPAPGAPGEATAPPALPWGGARGRAANNETRRHGEAPAPPAGPRSPAASCSPPPPPKTCRGKKPASPHPGRGASGAGRGQRGLPTGGCRCHAGDVSLRTNFGGGGR